MSAERTPSSVTQDSTNTKSQHPMPISAPGGAPLAMPAPNPSAILDNRNINGRGNGPVRQAALLHLQRTQGNRAVRRFLQQQKAPNAHRTIRQTIRGSGDNVVPRSEAPEPQGTTEEQAARISGSEPTSSPVIQRAPSDFANAQVLGIKPGGNVFTNALNMNTPWRRLQESVLEYSQLNGDQKPERRKTLGAILALIKEWETHHDIAKKPRGELEKHERDKMSAIGRLRQLIAKERPQLHTSSLLRIDGREYAIADVGSEFCRLDPPKAAYIYGSQVGLITPPTGLDDDEVSRGIGKYRVMDDKLEEEITKFLSGSLTLYRGVNRYNRQWHKLRKDQLLEPFGSGMLPDTSTINTAFLPFSPDRGTAVGFALTPASGFIPKDDVRFVHDYDPEDPEYEYGMLVSVEVGSDMGIGFINASEVQIKGPVKVDIEQIYKMGDDLGDIFKNDRYRGKTVGKDKAPEKPSDEEKEEYKVKYGNLIE